MCLRIKLVKGRKVYWRFRQMVKFFWVREIEGGMPLTGASLQEQASAENATAVKCIGVNKIRNNIPVSLHVKTR